MPPSTPFLDALARGLIEATQARENPEALGDAVVYLPNRRSGREFALALHRALRRGFLAPDIRTLGDIDDSDGTVAGPGALDLPPEISPARRRGALVRLIQAWRARTGEPPLPPASALAAADELTGLLDQASVAGDVDWSKVINLSLESDLAEHWRISASFLEIVAANWPAFLAEEGAMDAQMRRREAALRLATRWAADPPASPVLVAGSTGATITGRILMQAVLRLPRGAVVLPGLDPDLEDWTAVKEAPSHPQHALLYALEYLEVAPTSVRPFPAFRPETAEASARRRLINEALAPAESTRSWSTRLKHLAHPDPADVLVRRGLHNLALVEAEDESEEALAAAILLREALESGQTAALVSPDAGLARRVSAALSRWDVDAPSSAGEPLHRTDAGGLLLMLMEWACDPANPVMLLALLKHPLVALGREPADLHREVAELELGGLRGPRLSATLPELARRLASDREDRHGLKRPGFLAAARLIEDVHVVHLAAGGVFDSKTIDGAAAAEACAKLAERLAVTREYPRGQRVWIGAAGAKAAQFLEQLSILCEELGPLDTAMWPSFVQAAMQGQTTPPEGVEHPRLAIWGPLEARLQQRDVIILAGLNEGTWPKPPPADSFLNLKLRREVGLGAPDERIGLSAHDFAQLANASSVWLLRAKRAADQPTVASRWLWRLRTLAAGGFGDRETAEEALTSRGHEVLRWARALRTVRDARPAPPPRPRPPPERRNLLDMSPSRAATLIRDPYADYAKRVLGLAKLRAVGEEIDAAARGTAVHAAVESFRPDGGPPLEDLIVQELRKAGASPELIELERPLWLRAARRYLEWLYERAPRVRDVEVEKQASITRHTLAGPMVLGAKADRIELLDDGRLAIIDFKTGAPKTKKQVQSGLEPQLLLEAAIAAEARFGRIGEAETAELIYFQMSTSRAILKKAPGQPLELDEPIPLLAQQSLDGLVRLVNAFADEAQPYLSRPRVMSVKAATDFDRLARRGEWTIEDGEE